MLKIFIFIRSTSAQKNYSSIRNKITIKIYSENVLRWYLQDLHKKSINMYRTCSIFCSISATKYIIILSHYRQCRQLAYDYGNLLLIYANEPIEMYSLIQRYKYTVALKSFLTISFHALWTICKQFFYRLSYSLTFNTIRTYLLLWLENIFRFR